MFTHKYRLVEPSTTNNVHLCTSIMGQTSKANIISSLWNRLVSERMKYYITWRLALGSTLIFWGLAWGFTVTFEMGFDVDLPLDFKQVTAFFISTLIGLGMTTTLEILLFKKIFRKWTFGWALLLKTVFSSMVVISLIVFSAFIYQYFFGNFPLIGKIRLNPTELFSIPIFWGVAIYWGAIIDLNFFFLSVHTLTGDTLFAQYSRGRFYKPVNEQRVFLFIDMDGSVKTASRLGNDQYFKLLNEVYFAFSAPIEQFGAEIYQFVGDEIVMSWDLESGIDNNTCVKLFFELQEVLKENEGKYQDKYGVSPSFKGALHLGEVITGEVGFVRTGILYSGDVINTTARLERLSGKIKRKLLITDDLFHELNTSELRYENLGRVALKGVKENHTIYAVEGIRD